MPDETPPQDTQIGRDWKLELDADMVLRAQDADPAVIRERSPLLVEIAEQAVAEGSALLRPAVAWREFQVIGRRHEKLELSGGRSLTAKLLAQHLAPAERLVLMVCTIGPQLEARVAEVLYDDPPLGLALDALGSAATEALALAACTRQEDQMARAGWYTSMPLSPGMIGWDVEPGQRALFKLLDAAPIGVSLNESAQMIPRKSTSLVLGLSRQPFAEGSSCDYCAMRGTCHYKDHYVLVTSNP